MPEISRECNDRATFLLTIFDAVGKARGQLLDSNYSTATALLEASEKLIEHVPEPQPLKGKVDEAIEAVNKKATNAPIILSELQHEIKGTLFNQLIECVCGDK